MSSEYTLDIQLTELGFPDILEPLETPVKETSSCLVAPSDAPLSHSHSPTPVSAQSAKGQLTRGHQSVAEDPPAAAPAAAVEQDKLVPVSRPPETTPCTTAPHVPPSLQDKQPVSAGPVDAADGTALPVLPGGPDTDFNSTTGRGTNETPPLTAEEMEHSQKKDDGQTEGNSTEGVQGVENESDDSEVSEMDEEEEDDDEEEEGINSDSSHSGDYRCGVCDLELPSNFKLQDHMNLHTGARPYCCAECGKRFCQISNYRVHLRTHAQSKADPLLCRICLTSFKSEEGLKCHLSTTHFEKKFYECDLCKRIFTDLKECEWHVEWHKRTLGSFVCESCGRIFSSQKSLTRHQKKICHHRYSCTDCARSFTKKNALLKHSFSHLGLLPYTCVRCRCHFRLAKLYRQHKCEPQRIHCVACLGVFRSQADFQKHKKDTGCWGHQEPKGDEIRCLECGQSFATAEELKKHAGAHQRVLSCAECGKGFRSALLLMSHMGGHAGTRPCLCQSCGVGFPHQQSYDSHLRTCGKTPPPVKASKKRVTPKSTPPPVKPAPQPRRKQSLLAPPPTNTSNSAKPAATTLANGSNNPAAPVKDSGRTKGVAGAVSSGSRPEGGLWQLTLDKQPPLGANLVLFVPVSSTLANSLAFPPTIPQVLPIPQTHIQPHMVLQPTSRNELKLHEASTCLGMNCAPGVQLHLDVPFGLATGNKQDPGYVAPLDLSKKSTSTMSALTAGPPLVKSEPEDPEFSHVANGIEGKTFQSVDREETTLKANQKQCVKNLHNTAEMDRLKQMKSNATVLSPLDTSTTTPGLITDIKKEPPSPDYDPDVLPTAWKPDREIKMEVDEPSPACAVVHTDADKKLTETEEGLNNGHKEVFTV
ncbi:zinc finger protein 629 [Myripristis murdjan]|uniref:Zinc finger protein 629-like n=1 Tax=Myripristis murdjan TaxID=586833 RepID=A0A667Z0M2_9TELE|nr:zinc finger protein 629-like [Myripristis murdjan]XP_029929205.1 zinc finger protein 629-like [Myripristis murdjan]XP_029929206.1 zinc finger protein 629-like [Myripristis murdjan]XP_029929207.1 zinc finger protein 629-like [Myripristis murdjan]